MKNADQYDDPEFLYTQYWKGREYEHGAEEVAIKRLLGERHFDAAADVGGGYGRLSKLLRTYADKVTLVEPSKKQREIAKDYLKSTKNVAIVDGASDKLPLESKSVDLITMVRVMHHLPDPMPTFKEVLRVLKPGGLFIVEVASSWHFKGRVRAALHGKRVPTTPIDIRSPENQREDVIAFVNHHPKTVLTQLQKAGFIEHGVLSVSNLRSPALKKVASPELMVGIEKHLQRSLARFYFGPSIFILVEKK